MVLGNVGIFCLATHGEGEPCDNAKVFNNWLTGNVNIYIYINIYIFLRLEMRDCKDLSSQSLVSAIHNMNTTIEQVELRTNFYRIEEPLECISMEREMITNL